MRKQNRKIAVIYHGDCWDGFGAAYAAWKKFGNKAAYLAVQRKNAPPAVEGRTVYLLDFTYQGQELRKLMRQAARVTALDHHESQEKETKSTADYRYDLRKSGVTLAWEYFHPGKKTPLLLKYIEDMDLFRLALPRSQAVHAYLQLLPFDFRRLDKLVREFENPARRKEIIQQGTLLNTHFQSICDRIIKDGAELVDFAGYKVYAVNAPHLFSTEIGHKLYAKHPPFAIVWRKQGEWFRISLRGTGKPNLIPIARRFGGGGHRRAAAFSVPIQKGFPWKPVK